MVIPPAPSGGPYSEAMRNKSALTCSILAVAWGMVLVVGALTFPVYQGRTITVACPGCPLIVEVDASRTLVEVSGGGVLVAVSLPLVLAAASTLLLWRHRRGA